MMHGQRNIKHYFGVERCKRTQIRHTKVKGKEGDGRLMD